MKAALLRSKDFWSGLLLIAVGVLAVAVASGYPFGTMTRVGAGFFPIVLGVLLVLFGLYILVRGLAAAEPIEAGWSPRALVLLPASLALFGFLLDRAGLVPALAVLIVGSAAASRQFDLAEVALLALVLIAFAAAVFVWGLGLPYPLLVGL